MQQIPRRPGQAKRDPGTITTDVHFARGRSDIGSNSKHLWLWVPAFAGTTMIESAKRRSIDRLQPRLNLCAARLEERRQRQFFAECRQRLVGRKAGAVGCDLEQDAVGLSEIETAEIEPVDLAAIGNAQ